MRKQGLQRAFHLNRNYTIYQTYFLPQFIVNLGANTVAQLCYCKCLRFRYDECVEGGESILLDSLPLLEQLREDCPKHFATLTRVPATFQNTAYSQRYVHMYVYDARPSNSHGFTVRLTVSGLISRSHGLASKSHGFVAPACDRFLLYFRHFGTFL